MADVSFTSAVIGRSNVIAGDYSAQDLETQTAGNVVPFTYDFQFGFVWLGYDFVTNAEVTFNVFDSQDMELLAIGAISQIPATVFPTANVPPVQLLVGVFSQNVSILSDDFENYPIGPIIAAQFSTATGDITSGTTATGGTIRAYP